MDGFGVVKNDLRFRAKKRAHLADESQALYPRGFMLPSGTGPNAIAWATGHVRLAKVLKAGFWLDLAGTLLIVGVVWTMAAIAG